MIKFFKNIRKSMITENRTSHVPRIWGVPLMLNLLDIQKTAKTGILSFNEPSQIAVATVAPAYNTLLKKKEFIND